jgi:outer membrane protein TolC
VTFPVAAVERSSFVLAAAPFVLLMLYSPPSLALQPIEVFAAAARGHNPDALEAQANVSQQDAQADVALGRVLPGVSARGSYARNQYSSSVTLPALPGLPGSPGFPQTITITPYNQWFGSATVTVPLVDLANLRRVGASKTSAASSAQQLTATGLQVESQVVQDYFQLVANLALVTASNNALEVSRAGLRLAEAQYKAGAAAVLDVDRARADVEQQVQQVASAELQVALSARALQSTSGVTPDISTAVELADDLHPEPELSVFERSLPGLPSVAAAALNTRAAEEQAQAERFALAPSIAGNFTENATNAPGFVGHNWYYQGAITFNWSLDLTNLGNIRGQDAAVDVARARELRTRLSAADAIHKQWSTVVSGIARSRSARVGRAAADHAAVLARERYRVGTITQLDLLQAQRDAFNAEVSRIQADADLVNARVQLRLSSGQSLLTATARHGAG